MVDPKSSIATRKEIKVPKKPLARGDDQHRDLRSHPPA